MEIEANAKVVASVWGADCVQFLAALAVLPWSMDEFTVSSKKTEAKQLARQETEQVLPPKQTRRPLPWLLSPSFFKDWQPLQIIYSIISRSKEAQGRRSIVFSFRVASLLWTLVWTAVELSGNIVKSSFSFLIVSADTATKLLPPPHTHTHPHHPPYTHRYPPHRLPLWVSNYTNCRSW